MSFRQWTHQKIEDMTDEQLNAAIENIIRTHPRLQNTIGGPKGASRADKIKFLKNWYAENDNEQQKKQKGQQS